MAFKTEEFIGNFSKHNDFSKVSKFHVQIAQPQVWAPNKIWNFDELRFQCESAELPGYTINTVDARIYGVPAPVAAFASFSDLTLSFICAGDLWEKKLFDYWMNLIVPINNYHLRFKSEYASKITVTQFYETGEPSYIASFWNAFPITMGPLTTNWADDGIHRLSVTFKYDYWSTDGTESFKNSDKAPNTSQNTTRPPQLSGTALGSNRSRGNMSGSDLTTGSVVYGGSGPSSGGAGGSFNGTSFGIV